MPLRDAYGSPSQDATRKRASVSAIVDHGHAVDDYVGDAGRKAPRVIERRSVGDRSWIEHREIGRGAGAKDPAFDALERSSWRCRLLVRSCLDQTGRACLLCQRTSDVDLFRYGESVVDFDAKIATVLSIFVCPSSNCTALRFPVRR